MKRLRMFALSLLWRATVTTNEIFLGGEGEIRTRDRIAPMPVFKTGAFNRSATSPSATSMAYASILPDHNRLCLDGCIFDRIPLHQDALRASPYYGVDPWIEGSMAPVASLFAANCFKSTNVRMYQVSSSSGICILPFGRSSPSESAIGVAGASHVIHV
jgi:hypothetical protein